MEGGFCWCQKALRVKSPSFVLEHFEWNVVQCVDRMSFSLNIYTHSTETVLLFKYMYLAHVSAFGLTQALRKLGLTQDEHFFFFYPANYIYHYLPVVTE